MNIRYSFPRRGDYLRTQLIRFTYRFLSIRMNLLKTKKYFSILWKPQKRK